MEIHEFVCEDCEAGVYSFGGDPNAKLCSSCMTVRDIKARDPMTPEQEKALREILGCVIPVRKGEGPGTLIFDIDLSEEGP